VSVTFSFLDQCSHCRLARASAELRRLSLLPESSPLTIQLTNALHTAALRLAARTSTSLGTHYAQNTTDDSSSDDDGDELEEELAAGGTWPQTLRNVRPHSLTVSIPPNRGKWLHNICEMQSLRWLSLVAYSPLPACAQLPNLRTLIITAPPAPTPPRRFRDVAPFICSQPTITTLSLPCFEMQDIAHLPRGLTSLTQTHRVKASQARFPGGDTDRGWEALMSMPLTVLHCRFDLFNSQLAEMSTRLPRLTSLRCDAIGQPPMEALPSSPTVVSATSPRCSNTTDTTGGFRNLTSLCARMSIQSGNCEYNLEHDLLRWLSLPALRRVDFGTSDANNPCRPICDAAILPHIPVAPRIQSLSLRALYLKNPHHLSAVTSLTSLSLENTICVATSSPTNSASSDHSSSSSSGWESVSSVTSSTSSVASSSSTSSLSAVMSSVAASSRVPRSASLPRMNGVRHLNLAGVSLDTDEIVSIPERFPCLQQLITRSSASAPVVRTTLPPVRLSPVVTVL